MSQLVLTTVMSQAVADAIVGIVASTFETSDRSPGKKSYCALLTNAANYLKLDVLQSCLHVHDVSAVSRHSSKAPRSTRHCVYDRTLVPLQVI